MNEDFANAELGPKMQACNQLERRFVWFYVLNGGIGAQAARDAGYSDVKDGAKVRAFEALQREHVLDAIDEVGRKAFRSLLIPAITATRKLIENGKHRKHAATLQSTLSRLGLVERTGVDVNHTGEVQVNHTDAAVNDLRVLLGLGVTREKLEEVFGHSGLGRYEKMLAEQERGRPKVIEHRTEERSDDPAS